MKRKGFRACRCQTCVWWGHSALSAHVLDAMGADLGNQLQLIPGPDGYLLRPRRIDDSRLDTLRGKIPEGHPPFDIQAFREKSYDLALRD